MFRCGRVYLAGEEIDPYKLIEMEGVCIVEIVDGDYRIEQLEGEEDVKEQGE